jgi:hypothetical protein
MKGGRLWPDQLENEDKLRYLQDQPAIWGAAGCHKIIKHLAFSAAPPSIFR